MGAFNTLSVQQHCANCEQPYIARLQFKFGDTWQFEYHIDEKLNWGGNDNGEPGLKSVMVYGILENEICAKCGYRNKEDYDILMEKDVIKNVSLAEDIEKYGDDGFYV